MATVGVRVNIPTLNLKNRNYEGYKQELKAWREITDLPKNKQGVAVALSLPEPSKIGEQVFDELKIDDLKKTMASTH